MSDHIKHAEAETEAYKKKRKEELTAELSRLEAAATAQRDEQRDTAHTALKAAESTRLAAVDTAAVRAALTKKQVRDTLARQGLTGSGTEKARLAGAARAETIARKKADDTRDEAAATITAKRVNAEAAIERKRAEDVAKATASAQADIERQRESLTKAAYAAEAKEEAAAKSAAAKIEAARIKAEASQTKATLTAEQRQEESARKAALKVLYRGNLLTSELYAEALEKGYTVDEALAARNRYVQLNEVISFGLRLYQNNGFEAMMSYVAPYQLSEKEWDEFCRRTNISRQKVQRWIGGYNAWMEEDPVLSEKLSDIFRGGV